MMGISQPGHPGSPVVEPPRFRTEVLRASPRNPYEVNGFSADENHIGSILGL